jgi:pimeloyl-ACP methyl ester carboxylesterase
MPQLALADIDLHYEVYGEGEPVVLIPGLAGGAWIWFKQFEALARHFQVLTFDPCGVGKSGYAERPPVMRLMADDVAGLMQGLRIERAHILGASFGGFVAQEFVLAYPQMTQTLTLSCTSFGGPNHVPPTMETLAALASTDGFNTEDRIRRNLLPAFSPRFASEQPDEVENVIKLRLASPVNEGTYRWQLSTAVGFNAEARVAGIEAPTLLLTGDADEIVPVENSRNLAALIPGSQLSVIDGGSHLFFIEQPEEFNSAVIEFLKSH